MVSGKLLWCETCQAKVWARPHRTYTDRGGRTWALYCCDGGEHYIRELVERDVDSGLPVREAWAWTSFEPIQR